MEGEAERGVSAEYEAISEGSVMGNAGRTLAHEIGDTGVISVSQCM
jgi:hypothetical protein